MTACPIDNAWVWNTSLYNQRIGSRQTRRTIDRFYYVCILNDYQCLGDNDSSNVGSYRDTVTAQRGNSPGQVSPPGG